MYHHDWLMRQINTMIQLLGRILFKKDNVKFSIQDESKSTEIHLLYETLMGLINEHKINDAEDLLFENIDVNDLIYMKVAMDFYDRINRLGDDELENADFSRDEIRSGLEDAMNLYSIRITI
ncbi:MAG: DUF6483 family protein [Tissierellaceae bacterium]|nr:DUF6483 family protein [Tissierellaceae bacterium]